MSFRTVLSARQPARFLNYVLSTFCFFCLAFAASAEKPYPVPAPKDRNYFLAAYYLAPRPSRENRPQIHFAVSNGKEFIPLNNGAPVLNAKEFARSGMVHNPYIIRAADGGFRMVAMDRNIKISHYGVGIVLLKSDDLTEWSAKSVYFPERFPDLKDKLKEVSYPRVIYDPAAKKYLVYFSMDQSGGSTKLYGAYANADFTDLETAPRLMWELNDRSVVNARISPSGGKYYVFDGYVKAVSDTLFPGKWEVVARGRQVLRPEPEAGPEFKLIGERILAAPGEEEALKGHVRHFMLTIEDTDAASGDNAWKKRSDAEKDKGLVREKVYTTNFFPEDYLIREGSRIAIARSELNALFEKWGRPKNLLPDAPPLIRYWENVPGIGPFVRTNPIIEAFYADPGTLYSEKTGKYYIYPTHDGFPGWGGKDFQAFSSDDLKNWKFERTILTLGEDVKWSSGNAWAPCIMERKQPDGSYKYYFYFCGALKSDGRKCIGCAVADDPLGPFVDTGKPVIDFKPEGVRGGQEIDPDVFRDPASGKYYLYWGNGYMAGAELADDMLSVKRDTVKVFRPGRTFREGTNVIYRKGKYYFSWSVDDTGSPNYHVRYATADSPLGDLTVPRDNIVIEKDPSKGILGTGHHQILKVRGADDEWRIVYHRFAWQQDGKVMDGPGFHREVCIDKLEFNDDGSIKKVVPTL